MARKRRLAVWMHGVQVAVRPGMAVNGRTSIHAVMRADLLEEARRWRLPLHHASEWLDELLAGLPLALRAAARAVPATPPELVELVTRRALAVSEGLAVGDSG